MTRCTALEVVCIAAMLACNGGGEPRDAAGSAAGGDDAAAPDPGAATGLEPGDASTEQARSVDTSFDDCRVPPDARALCLSFTPEAVAPEPEPGLDQRGSFTVQVFDTPAPPAGAANSSALLYERTAPLGLGSGKEIALANLPAPTVLLDAGPSTVFVRALFFDNLVPAFERGDGLGWGTWIGGLDLSRGLVEDPALLPVPIDDRRVTTHDVPLVAMRRLEVTVTTSATPVGDGEGALSVVASRSEGLPPDVQTHGYGIEPCVDVSSGPVMVDVVLLGSGTFFVTAFFDDLGIETPGGLPPGTMLSIDDAKLETGEATYDSVTIAEGQYSAELSVDLGFVSDMPEGSTEPGPNSCADLGLPTAP